MSPLYNVATDFAPVTLIVEQPIVLLARKDLTANNLAEFTTTPVIVVRAQSSAAFFAAS